MNEPFFSPLVERAMRVAAQYHQGQTRKASDIPYLTHPASVAAILLKAGFQSEDILAAALLHDVVEDTDLSLEDLANEFPEPVVLFVAALTEEKQTGDGKKIPWKERKLHHIEQIAQAPLQARAIVLADKLHNLGTMVFDLEAGDELWSRFGARPEEVCWYHRTMIESATQNDEPLFPLSTACINLLDVLESHVEKGSF
jgi:(p)ppGpp synthase/HD superfamily hydrolase